MTNSQFEGKWERRYHPLRQEWVVYAAHRNARPWSTGRQEHAPNQAPTYDPKCYLCPGNTRISGHANPNYQDVYIFTNDHPVLGPDAPAIADSQKLTGEGLYQRHRAIGTAKVICYDPNHKLTLADMPVERIAGVFGAMRTEMQAFAQDPVIKSVLIFENKGELVGVSNPHPHGQIYACDFVLNFTQTQLKATQQWRETHNESLFERIIKNEQKDQIRIIAENDTAIAFIPFFARYAYEVMVFPKNPHSTLATLTNAELHDLSAVFQQVVRRFDVNFKMSFPYVMSVQQAPVDGQAYPDFRAHLLLLPPLRQPGLQKFLAGPEIGANTFMADTMPEDKAAELRAVNLNDFVATQ